MRKVLMLWPEISEDIPMIIQDLYSDIVSVENLYKKTNVFGRMLRKKLSKFNRSTKYFYSNWFKNIHEYEIIIIHANVINRTVPNVLRKNGFKGRIIYWYWNPVINSISPNKINRDNCELWSFDKEDCKTYDMRYNSTYYFNFKPNNDFISEYDMFFIGRDKGRYKEIRAFEHEMNDLGYKTNFMIIRDSTSMEDGIYSDLLPYTKVVELVKKSKCIVEFLQSGQTGLSLRVMEALFFQKKIITNNNALRNEKFYNNNNFFIINNNNNKIKYFMDSNYSKLNDSMINYYDFKNWLHRFEKECD